MACAARSVASVGNIVAPAAGMTLVEDSTFAVVAVDNTVVAVVDHDLAGRSLLGKQQIHLDIYIGRRWVAVDQDSMASCKEGTLLVECEFLVNCYSLGCSPSRSPVRLLRMLSLAAARSRCGKPRWTHRTQAGASSATYLKPSE